MHFNQFVQMSKEAFAAIRRGESGESGGSNPLGMGATGMRFPPAPSLSFQTCLTETGEISEKPTSISVTGTLC